MTFCTKAGCAGAAAALTRYPIIAEGAGIVHCAHLQMNGFPTTVGTMDHNGCHSGFLSLGWIMQMWQVQRMFPGVSVSMFISKWLPTQRGGSQWSPNDEGLM